MMIKQKLPIFSDWEFFKSYCNSLLYNVEINRGKFYLYCFNESKFLVFLPLY